MSVQFDDGKDEGALRTIGEVSQALGLKPHVLRYWEQQFPMLEPLKRSGGRRYYRPEDVALIERIDRLVNVEGYTLKGAEALLKGGETPADDTQSGASGQSSTSAREQAPKSADRPARKAPPGLIEQLKSLRQDLARAIEA